MKIGTNRDANSPSKKPTYSNLKLNPYAYGNTHRNLGLDRFFFAPNLIKEIQNTQGQEIGTHTYSHYYCLETGQNKEQFADDLDTAIKLANKFTIIL